MTKLALPPIFFHHFRTPLPYSEILLLQEKIHEIQVDQRSQGQEYKDVFLLLQHRPVYTSGRRQTHEEVSSDRQRLLSLGADFVTTARGGQLTYHGPGQLVGYPLLDLSRPVPAMRTRDYVDRMQRALDSYLREYHGIQTIASDNTGVFLNAHTKLASIGIQIRHSLTTHGFAMNVTNEPLAWFKEVVACGLADVEAGSIESSTGEKMEVESVLPGIIKCFEINLDRAIEPLNMNSSEKLTEAIHMLENSGKN